MGLRPRRSRLKNLWISARPDKALPLLEGRLHPPDGPPAATRRANDTVSGRSTGSTPARRWTTVGAAVPGTPWPGPHGRRCAPSRRTATLGAASPGALVPGRSAEQHRQPFEREWGVWDGQAVGGRDDHRVPGAVFFQRKRADLGSFRRPRRPSLRCWEPGPRPRRSSDVTARAG